MIPVCSCNTGCQRALNSLWLAVIVGIVSMLIITIPLEASAQAILSRSTTQLRFYPKVRQPVSQTYRLRQNILRATDPWSGTINPRMLEQRRPLGEGMRTIPGGLWQTRTEPLGETKPTIPGGLWRSEGQRATPLGEGMSTIRGEPWRSSGTGASQRNRRGTANLVPIPAPTGR